MQVDVKAAMLRKGASTPYTACSGGTHQSSLQNAAPAVP